MPEKHSSAAILTLGDEILLGRIADTNASYIATRVIAAGWPVTEIRTVGDCLEEIVHALKELAARHEVLIITGGLGPTADDLTRQAIAAAAGVKLEENPEMLQWIEERFNALGLKVMNQSNRLQALLPEGGIGLQNSNGTAPGIAIELDGCQCFALPGVPLEMREMLQEHIIPALGQGRQGEAIIVRELHLWGGGESTIGTKLSDLMQRGRNPAVGTCAETGIITVRIVASADTKAAAQQLIQADEEEIRRRLGEIVFGADGTTLAGAVIDLLAGRNETLALAESCTGGLIGKLITDIPGASAVFTEGFITYTNAAKSARLGVPAEMILEQGAVSEEVSRAMAEGVRRTSGSTFGIGVTGIAGPGGEPPQARARIMREELSDKTIPRSTQECNPRHWGGDEPPDKPVGLVHIAVAGPVGTIHRECRFIHDREGNRTRTAITALGMLRQMIRSS